jgi:hypothetical protein
VVIVGARTILLSFNFPFHLLFLAGLCSLVVSYICFFYTLKRISGKKILKTTTSSPSSENTYPTNSTNIRWYASTFLNEEKKIEREREKERTPSNAAS